MERTFSAAGTVRLPSLVRDLEIDYTALSFVNPRRVRFRYRLEGRDASWQEAGTRRQAFYNDLGPGQYRFHVIACNNDQVWNEAGATLVFSIPPAWYPDQVVQSVVCGCAAIADFYAVSLKDESICQIHESEI